MIVQRSAGQISEDRVILTLVAKSARNISFDALCQWYMSKLYTPIRVGDTALSPFIPRNVHVASLSPSPASETLKDRLGNNVALLMPATELYITCTKGFGLVVSIDIKLDHFAVAADGLHIHKIQSAVESFLVQAFNNTRNPSHQISHAVCILIAHFSMCGVSERLWSGDLATDIEDVSSISGLVGKCFHSIERIAHLRLVSGAELHRQRSVMGSILLSMEREAGLLNLDLMQKFVVITDGDLEVNISQASAIVSSDYKRLRSLDVIMVRAMRQAKSLAFFPNTRELQALAVSLHGSFRIYEKQKTTTHAALADEDTLLRTCVAGRALSLSSHASGAEKSLRTHRVPRVLTVNNIISARLHAGFALTGIRESVSHIKSECITSWVDQSIVSIRLEKVLTGTFILIYQINCIYKRPIIRSMDMGSVSVSPRRGGDGVLRSRKKGPLFSCCTVEVKVAATLTRHVLLQTPMMDEFILSEIKTVLDVDESLRSVAVSDQPSVKANSKKPSRLRNSRRTMLVDLLRLSTGYILHVLLYRDRLASLSHSSGEILWSIDLQKDIEGNITNMFYPGVVALDSSLESGKLSILLSTSFRAILDWFQVDEDMMESDLTDNVYILMEIIGRSNLFLDISIKSLSFRGRLKNRIDTELSNAALAAFETCGGFRVHKLRTNVALCFDPTVGIRVDPDASAVFVFPHGREELLFHLLSDFAASKLKCGFHLVSCVGLIETFLPDSGQTTFRLRDLSGTLSACKLSFVALSLLSKSDAMRADAIIACDISFVENEEGVQCRVSYYWFSCFRQAAVDQFMKALCDSDLLLCGVYQTLSSLFHHQSSQAINLMIAEEQYRVLCERSIVESFKFRCFELNEDLNSALSSSIFHDITARGGELCQVVTLEEGGRFIAYGSDKSALPDCFYLVDLSPHPHDSKDCDSNMQGRARYPGSMYIRVYAISLPFYFEEAGMDALINNALGRKRCPTELAATLGPKKIDFSKISAVISSSYASCIVHHIHKAIDAVTSVDVETAIASCFQLPVSEIDVSHVFRRPINSLVSVPRVRESPEFKDLYNALAVSLGNVISGVNHAHVFISNSLDVHFVRFQLVQRGDQDQENSWLLPSTFEGLADEILVRCLTSRTRYTTEFSLRIIVMVPRDEIDSSVKHQCFLRSLHDAVKLFISTDILKMHVAPDIPSLSLDQVELVLSSILSLRPRRTMAFDILTPQSVKRASSFETAIVKAFEIELRAIEASFSQRGMCMISRSWKMGVDQTGSHERIPCYTILSITGITSAVIRSSRDNMGRSSTLSTSALAATTVAASSDVYLEDATTVEEELFGLTTLTISIAVKLMDDDKIISTDHDVEALVLRDVLSVLEQTWHRVNQTMSLKALGESQKSSVYLLTPPTVVSELIEKRLSSRGRLPIPTLTTLIKPKADTEITKTTPASLTESNIPSPTSVADLPRNNGKKFGVGVFACDFKGSIVTKTYAGVVGSVTVDTIIRSLESTVAQFGVLNNSRYFVLNSNGTIFYMIFDQSTATERDQKVVKLNIYGGSSTVPDPVVLGHLSGLLEHRVIELVTKSLSSLLYRNPTLSAAHITFFRQAATSSKRLETTFTLPDFVGDPYAYCIMAKHIFTQYLTPSRANASQASFSEFLHPASFGYKIGVSSYQPPTHSSSAKPTDRFRLTRRKHVASEVLSSYRHPVFAEHSLDRVDGSVVSWNSSDWTFYYNQLAQAPGALSSSTVRGPQMTKVGSGLALVEVTLHPAASLTPTFMVSGSKSIVRSDFLKVKKHFEKGITGSVTLVEEATSYQSHESLFSLSSSASQSQVRVSILPATPMNAVALNSLVSGLLHQALLAYMIDRLATYYSSTTDNNPDSDALTLSVDKSVSVEEILSLKHRVVYSDSVSKVTAALPLRICEHCSIPSTIRLSRRLAIIIRTEMLRRLNTIFPSLSRSCFSPSIFEGFLDGHTSGEEVAWCDFEDFMEPFEITLLGQHLFSSHNMADASFDEFRTVPGIKSFSIEVRMLKNGCSVLGFNFSKLGIVLETVTSTLTEYCSKEHDSRQNWLKAHVITSTDLNQNHDLVMALSAKFNWDQKTLLGWNPRRKLEAETLLQSFDLALDQLPLSIWKQGSIVETFSVAMSLNNAEKFPQFFGLVKEIAMPNDFVQLSDSQGVVVLLLPRSDILFTITLNVSLGRLMVVTRSVASTVLMSHICSERRIFYDESFSLLRNSRPRMPDAIVMPTISILYDRSCQLFISLLTRFIRSLVMERIGGNLSDPPSGQKRPLSCVSVGIEELDMLRDIKRKFPQLSFIAVGTIDIELIRSAIQPLCFLGGPTNVDLLRILSETVDVPDNNAWALCLSSCEDQCMPSQQTAYLFVDDTNPHTRLSVIYVAPLNENEGSRGQPALNDVMLFSWADNIVSKSSRIYFQRLAWNALSSGDYHVDDRIRILNAILQLKFCTRQPISLVHINLVDDILWLLFTKRSHDRVDAVAALSRAFPEQVLVMGKDSSYDAVFIIGGGPVGHRFVLTIAKKRDELADDDDTRVELSIVQEFELQLFDDLQPVNGYLQGRGGTTNPTPEDTCSELILEHALVLVEQVAEILLSII